MSQNSEEKVRKIYDVLSQQYPEEGEVFYSVTDSRTVSIRKGKVTDSKKSVDEGYSIRIVKEGRVGFAYSTDFTGEGITRTIQKAESTLRYSNPDPDNILPQYKKNPAEREPLGNYDPKLTELSFEELTEMALGIEKKAYSSESSVNNTEEIEVSAGAAETGLISGNIPFTRNAGTFIGGYGEIIASREGINESGSYMQYVSSLKDFSPEKIGTEAARRAAVLLDAGKIQSQEMDLILDPLVSVKFLSLLSSLFDAEEVYKGKSLLKNKIGQEISSSLLSVYDDGMMPGGLSSAYYDDEGVPAGKTQIIKQGILKNYLADSKNARRSGQKSTGNAYRSSYKTQPSISPSNLYIQPGEQSPEEYIKSMENGLYIFEVMGLHTANPISGEFSLGAQGIIIKNGQKQKAVRGIMIAGNIIDFLKHINFIGNDMEFFPYGGNLGAPTIGVKNIMVGG